MAANGSDGALHVHGAVEVRAFHDPDAGCRNIATNFRGRRDEHRDNAAQVTFNGTFNDNTTSMSIADDDAVDPNRDTLRMVDRAFHATLEDDVLVGRELTLENEGLAENGHLLGGVLGRRRSRGLGLGLRSAARGYGE